jgi:hypothetical protein
VQGARDLTVGDDLFLAATNQNIPKCSWWEIWPLGQEEDFIELRADERPFHSRPDAGSSSKQSDPSAFVRSDNQHPCPAAYLRGQVFEHLSFSIGREQSQAVVSNATISSNDFDRSVADDGRSSAAPTIELSRAMTAANVEMA